MALTLLLDLDDTLLGTNLPDFVPAYFRALSQCLADQISPAALLPALVSGMKLMAENTDPRLSLQDVFESQFYPAVGVSRQEMAAPLDHFYEHVFPELSALTTKVAGASEFVDWALGQGFRLSVATDPLFPRKATRERLRWAGLDSHHFEVITSFEEFHFSKSQPEFYAEILGRMGWPAGGVIMIGNDFERDILPARRLGVAAIHVAGAQFLGSGNGGRAADLEEVRFSIEGAAPGQFTPKLQTAEAILATLRATPAVLLGMSRSLTDEEWQHEAEPGGWSLVEVVCHLRDTEREVHQSQIHLFEQQGAPFVPRPDAGVWARQRSYRSERGERAVGEFASARMETLAMLAEIGEPDWMRPAKHAIFGPTTFLEVVGFMAEHDRLHLQQAHKTLRPT